MLRDAYYECAKATDGVTSAIQDCIEAEFEYQDARLNTVYKHLHQKLGGNDKTALVEAQRQWLHEADKKCTWDSATEGQAQRLQANDCLLKLTAMRADELEAMVQN